MQAVVQNRIFLEVDPEQEKDILRNLTYAIPSYKSSLPPRVITSARIIRPGLMSIPSGRVDLIPPGHEIINKRVEVPIDFPKFNATLRPSQQAIYDSIESDARIQANPSFGKTFTGLSILGKLQQKSLVIVHTLALKEQWGAEVQKVYGFTPSFIGAGTFDTSKPITIANTQSLYRIPVERLNKTFGTVMVDECHHIPAKSFSDLVDSSWAKYKIGLSASARRKDGLHVLFQDYFGNTVYKPPKENDLIPEVHRISLNIRFADGNQSWAEKLSDLVDFDDYQKQIAMIAAYYASIGHKVLVVSSRTKLLERMHELTPKNSVCVIGDIKKDRNKLVNTIRTGEADILYGSTNIFAEGISVEEFSCLVLATPMNNEPLLEQLIGRVIRRKEGKKSPIVVDPQLEGVTVSKQQNLRKGYYMRSGYTIKDL
jgi:superfamily II DNA or RNA helicase